MNDVRRASRLLMTAAAFSFAALAGCAGKVTVMIPPRADLAAYERVGMIEFTTDADPRLRELGTKDFLRAVQSAQPGVPILQLGTQRDVLERVQRERLDFAAVQAIGETYGVDAVIVGHLDVDEVKPRVNVNDVFSMNASAGVEASLDARLVETRGGATIWSNTASGSGTIAHLDLREGEFGGAGVANADSLYGKLIRSLVFRVARDFETRYEKRRPDDIPTGAVLVSGSGAN